MRLAMFGNFALHQHYARKAPSSGRVPRKFRCHGRIRVIFGVLGGQFPSEMWSEINVDPSLASPNDPVLRRVPQRTPTQPVASAARRGPRQLKGRGLIPGSSPAVTV